MGNPTHIYSIDPDILLNRHVRVDGRQMLLTEWAQTCWKRAEADTRYSIGQASNAIHEAVLYGSPFVQGFALAEGIELITMFEKTHAWNHYLDEMQPYLDPALFSRLKNPCYNEEIGDKLWRLGADFPVGIDARLQVFNVNGWLFLLPVEVYRFVDGIKNWLSTIEPENSEYGHHLWEAVVDYYQRNEPGLMLIVTMI